MNQAVDTETKAGPLGSFPGIQHEEEVSAWHAFTLPLALVLGPGKAWNATERGSGRYELCS